MFRRINSTLAILGILLGLGLYFHAAALYSAATSNDPARGGYRHFGDYWCTLYSTVTYTGQTNTGRPYALASTLVLVITFLFFWFCVSALFVEFAGLCLMVRIAGSVAVAAASFIFTPLHDIVITVAAPLGFVAVLAACIGLVREREFLLFLLGVTAVTVAISDYTLWKMEMLRPYQPLIQKSAFMLIFLWVLVTAVKVLGMNHESRKSPRHLEHTI